MSSPAEEDRKPNAAGEGGASSESNEQIHIRVRCPDHEDVQFKIKKRTALSKVMDAYCSKPNRDRGVSLRRTGRTPAPSIWRWKMAMCECRAVCG